MPQKGKHRPPHHKEKKQRVAPVAQAQTKTQPAQQAAAPSAPAAPVKVVARQSVPQTPAAFSQARFPFVGSELRFIGIIAVAIIILLVVLAIVLPPLLP